eukprot:100568-Pyramimonas_sp.AAC.1
MASVCDGVGVAHHATHLQEAWQDATQVQAPARTRAPHRAPLLHSCFVILLHFMGPPVPITARMHSTSQIALLFHCSYVLRRDSGVLSASLPLLAQEDP